MRTENNTNNRETPEYAIARLAESDSIFAFQATLNTLFFSYFGSIEHEGTASETRQQMAYHLQVLNDTLLSAHKYKISLKQRREVLNG